MKQCTKCDKPLVKRDVCYIYGKAVCRDCFDDAVDAARRNYKTVQAKRGAK